MLHWLCSQVIFPQRFVPGWQSAQMIPAGQTLFLPVAIACASSDSINLLQLGRLPNPAAKGL